MDSAATTSPYLAGNYAPIDREITAERLPVIGELPRELSGVFVRNASNARFAARGRYHWFDGDGMIHAVHFEDGVASYRNRWVRTEGFLAEERAGEAQWTGLLERPDHTRLGGPYKNTANTDLVFHAGRCLALWWMSGTPYVMRLPSLDTVGAETYGGRLLRGFAAHPKVDPRTGELVYMHFSPTAPFLEYGVIDREGAPVHHVAIDLPGSRLQHDIAITERYSILLDMAMHNDPVEEARGRVRVKFFRDQPSRFGVIPRRGASADVRWFEVAPCYIYHLINAWEEDDAIVIVGCRIADPLVGDPGNAPTNTVVPAIAAQRLAPIIYRWRLDLLTGAVREEALDDVLTEFPRMDNRRLGAPSTVSYNPRIAPSPTLSFDGVIRYDHERGRSTTHAWPRGWFGGETVFAPREGGTAEDDGWLLTFVVEEASGASELYVIDARNVELPPVARVPIPQRVPTGYHSWWVPAGDLATQRG